MYVSGPSSLASWPTSLTDYSRDGHGQHMGIFLLPLPVVVLTRSNESKDNLYDLLPISNIPTNPTNPTKPYQIKPTKKTPKP